MLDPFVISFILEKIGMFWNLIKMKSHNCVIYYYVFLLSHIFLHMAMPCHFLLVSNTRIRMYKSISLAVAFWFPFQAWTIMNQMLITNLVQVFCGHIFLFPLEGIAES